MVRREGRNHLEAVSSGIPHCSGGGGDEGSHVGHVRLDPLHLLLGMLLLLPKFIQLLTLVLGWISMSYATCQMEINPSIEPKKLVRFFGRMCMFSFVYCILTQLAIYNILSDIGIPFYK